VTRGRKLRIDSTVVETTIHHPSDSGLLADGVRVLSRLVRRAGDLLARGTEPLFRDRTRSAKRLMRHIQASAAVTGRGAATAAAERTELYRRLLEVAQSSLRQAETVQHLLAASAGDAIERVRAQVEHFMPFVQQVRAQTQRRVLEGEAVPATDKVVSLFEPHTAVIRRGKLSTPTEFGSKVLLDEVDGGLVTRYVILGGNPPDAPELPASLDLMTIRSSLVTRRTPRPPTGPSPPLPTSSTPLKLGYGAWPSRNPASAARSAERGSSGRPSVARRASVPESRVVSACSSAASACAAAAITAATAWSAGWVGVF